MITTFNWRVASPSTLRAYAVAVKDYETSTGVRVDRADAASIGAWQKSMQERGLSINTIRARLSAVSVVSGVKVNLPKRQKLEVTLSIEQVRSFFAVIKKDEDRALLASLFFTGMRPATFAAHFAGISPTNGLSTQEITRKVKRYAELAGMESNVMNLRTLIRSGRILLKSHQAAELVKSLSPTTTANGAQIPWKRLHGIGRRTHTVKA